MELEFLLTLFIIFLPTIALIRMTYTNVKRQITINSTSIYAVATLSILIKISNVVRIEHYNNTPSTEFNLDGLIEGFVIFIMIVIEFILITVLAAKRVKSYEQQKKDKHR